MKLASYSKPEFPVPPNPPPAAGAAAARVNSYFLHAGQVYVSLHPQSIVFILGSCVAVCIWDALNGIGGATHFLLPEWDGRGVASPRYGSVAIPTLLRALVEAGARREMLRARLFGGGCLFEAMRGNDSGSERLGDRNAEIALEILAKERIPVVSTEVGTVRGRRVVFQTNTGESHVSSL